VTASTALANSTNSPSPVVLTIQPGSDQSFRAESPLRPRAYQPRRRPSGDCNRQHRPPELLPIAALAVHPSPVTALLHLPPAYSIIASRFLPAHLGERVPPKPAMTTSGHSLQIVAHGKSLHVRFSNRPFEVKRFQTIRRCGVDVTHGLVLLFGIGTKAVPSWDSRTRWNNLFRGLAVRPTAGSSGSANSPHPSSREGHHSTARWSSSFLLSDVILHSFQAATACSLVQRNSVPSTQMRCMITADRRARATIAFFFPRRLAICIAQALSHDHFFECSML